METYSVKLEKIFYSSRKNILDMFRNNTVFRLTSADKVENDFRTGGAFDLKFSDRGRVFGKFIKISDDEIIINWNVEGFDLPKETGTVIKFTITEENEKCILKLEHINIVNKESAEAKKEGWTEILDDMEKELSTGKK